MFGNVCNNSIYHRICTKWHHILQNSAHYLEENIMELLLIVNISIHLVLFSDINIREVFIGRTKCRMGYKYCILLIFCISTVSTCEPGEECGCKDDEGVYRKGMFFSRERFIHLYEIFSQLDKNQTLTAGWLYDYSNPATR